MKIQVEVEIFDDPEYCNDEEYDCPFLDQYENPWCNLFRCYNAEKHIFSVKNSDCKAAYQKAKS